MAKKTRKKDEAFLETQIDSETRLDRSMVTAQWVFSAMFDLKREQWVLDPVAMSPEQFRPERLSHVVREKILAAKRLGDGRNLDEGFLSLSGLVNSREATVGDFFAEVSRSVYGFLTESVDIHKTVKLGGSVVSLQYLTTPGEWSHDVPIENKGTSEGRSETTPSALDRSVTDNDPRTAALAGILGEIRALSEVDNVDVLEVLERLRFCVETIRRLTGQEVEKVFNQYEDKEFSPDVKKQVATLMDAIATSLELRFAVKTSDGSHFTASLRCGSSGRPNDERFQYQAYEGGKTTIRRSSKNLLRSTLVPAPRDRRRRGKRGL